MGFRCPADVCCWFLTYGCIIVLGDSLDHPLLFPEWFRYYAAVAYYTVYSADPIFHYRIFNLRHFKL